MKFFENLTSKNFKALTWGSLSTGVISLLFALVVFSGKSFYDNQNKIGMQMGMSMNPMTSESNVWMYIPRALHIKARMAHFVKYDENDNESEAELLDVLSMQFGGATVHFDIMEADEETMPQFSNKNDALTPMAYIKDTTIPFSKRVMMIFFAVVLNNWGFVKFVIIASSLSSVLLGLYLRRKSEPVKKEISFALK